MKKTRIITTIIAVALQAATAIVIDYCRENLFSVVNVAYPTHGNFPAIQLKCIPTMFDND